MKHFFLSIILFSFFSNAQNIENDSILDSNNDYIENYHNQLNVKFEISNEVKNYLVPFLGEEARISPNINFRYALGFNYKFASVRIGIRSGQSDKNKLEKGESDNFRLKVKFLFTNWSHKFEYNYVKGYYIKNSESFSRTIEDVSNHLQFPNMKTSVFSGTSAYKFNRNYSIRATQSQTEIQTKSVGTLMPSVDYWYYKISDNQIYIDSQGNTIVREKFNKYKGLNTIANIGYYYTFVYKKNWYATVFAAPGIGIDFYTITTNTSDDRFSNNYNSFVFSIQSGAAIGYSAERYYFGADYNNRHTYENYAADRFQFNTSANTFHIFIGYRFRPPKTVSNTVEFIEKKVPILQKEPEN
ncbi:MAG: DUF4421 family protein [Bacteroidota bacterium]